MSRDWMQDLRNVAATAAIDDLPTPLCATFTWDQVGQGTLNVTVLTEADAGAWEKVLNDRSDAWGPACSLTTSGPIDGGTIVRITTVSDLYTAHVASALDAVQP